MKTCYLKDEIRIGPLPLFTLSHMAQQRKCTSANKKEKRHTTLVNECTEDAMVQRCQLCLPTVVKYSDSTTGSCGEAVTHTGISLITCCPSGLLYTRSPFHFLPQHSNDTLEQQRLQRTQHSVGRAQVGPKWACKCKSTVSLTTQTIGT